MTVLLSLTKYLQQLFLFRRLSMVPQHRSLMLKCALKTCSCNIFSKQVKCQFSSTKCFCALSIAVLVKVNVNGLYRGNILKI